MRAVLGIDAAWTARQPSGVAVAAEGADGWRLIAAEPSYTHFIARGQNETIVARPTGERPNVGALVAAVQMLAGAPPVLVAVDMPLARSPIIGRRAADNAVSRAYGGRKCSTHSPSAERPGAISDQFRSDFAAAGYPLLTRTLATPGLIEVYPHPALVEIMVASERLPYKAGKTRTYWPGLDRSARADKLALIWMSIATALDMALPGTVDAIADSARHSAKAREDVLDAIICCVVAVQALQGRCLPFGDDDAAIWIPAG